MDFPGTPQGFPKEISLGISLEFSPGISPVFSLEIALCTLMGIIPKIHSGNAHEIFPLVFLEE